MRKTITLLLLALLTSVGAWAEDTYESVYERAVDDWTVNDSTEWSKSTSVKLDASKGLGADGNQTATYLSKAFTVADGSKIKYVVDWTYSTATGRTSNWNWIQFGSFLRIAINSSYNMQVSTDAGATWNTTTLGYYYNNTFTKKIEVIFDTKAKKVEKLSFDGTDRTSLVSGTFSDASFNTISTGFVRGGSVSWTLTNFITTIAVSEAKQDSSNDVNYTINYVFGDDVIKIESGSLAVGSTVNAESPITVDNVKYYIVDGATTSMELGEEETDNVLDVEMRKAGTKTVSIIAVDGDGNELKRFSTVCVEGEAEKNLFYTRAVEYDGKYYTVPAVNGNGTNYGKSVSYTSSDENKVYTLDESITYYAEETDLTLTGTFRGNPQVLERASGGAWNNLSAKAALSTIPLISGNYTIDLSARNHGSADGSLDVQVRDADGNVLSTVGSLTWAKSANAIMSLENISVPEGATITIAETTNNTSNIDIDYLIAYRTGGLTETVTVATEGTSTYVTTYPLDFSDVEGLTVLIATDETQGYVELSKVTQVPAGAPIIVKGEAGDYSVPACDATTYSDNLTNKLEGSATESYTVTADDNIYAIKKDKSEFRPVAVGVEIPAKKAYFRSIYPVNANAKPFIIRGEEEDPTAVSTVEVVEAAKAKKFFNAAGQQVDENYKGFVITSAGKKIINK